MLQENKKCNFFKAEVFSVKVETQHSWLRLGYQRSGFESYQLYLSHLILAYEKPVSEDSLQGDFQLCFHSMQSNSLILNRTSIKMYVAKINSSDLSYSKNCFSILKLVFVPCSEIIKSSFMKKEHASKLRFSHCLYAASLQLIRLILNRLRPILLSERAQTKSTY